MEVFTVDRNVAELLMKRLVALDVDLNGAMEVIEQISDDEELKRFRREIADLVAAIYTNLMVPVLRQYPELDPDKDEEQSDNPGD
jgi:signal recognition particle GTPase